jgi:hypothetical protein
MKKGIIIVFSDDEKEIHESQFDRLLDKRYTKFCFVNNASKDKTLAKLNTIKNKTINDISIIDVKKNKGLKAAVKAGVRYLMNNEELVSIFYFEFYKYNDFLNPKFKLDIIFNRKKHINLLINNESRNILKNVFSLDQLIKEY